MDLFKKETYLGAPVKRKKVIYRKVKQSDYFNETFKVIEYLDDLSEKLNKSRDYEYRLERYERALTKNISTEEYDYIKDQIDDLKRKIATKQHHTTVELTNDQVDTIIHNIDVESVKPQEYVDGKREELRKVNEKMKELELTKDQIINEIREVQPQLDLAESLKFIVKKNKVDLTRGKGFSLYHSFRKHYKPYVTTEEVKEVK